MSDAQRLVQCLLDADKRFGAKSFIKRLSTNASVSVRLGAPVSKIVTVPLKWENDIIYQGGSTLPGAVLRGLSSPPPGLTEAQWDYVLEIIEYALNEGYEEWSGGSRYEPGEVDPDSDMWHPAFTWRYVGGLAAFKRDQARARSR